ncbi:MAG: hypothetical protein HC837_02660 [Chloroflexaceae bacterium]|nr:hypothetical protein [Chloroflexaceae bacterium]
MGSQRLPTTIINFGQPFSDRDITQLQQLRLDTSTIWDIPAYMDQSQPLRIQVKSIVDACGMPAYQWKETTFYVHPPVNSALALGICAEIASRCGYWPPVIATFSTVEILDLQSIADRTGRS